MSRILHDAFEATPGGAIHDLAGTSAGTGISSGLLGLFERISAAALGQSSAVSSLAIYSRLAGVTSSLGSLTGVLSVTRLLSAITQAASNAAAGLAAIRRLSGEFVGASSAAVLATIRPAISGNTIR